MVALLFAAGPAAAMPFTSARLDPSHTLAGAFDLRPWQLDGVGPLPIPALDQARGVEGVFGSVAGAGMARAASGRVVVAEEGGTGAGAVFPLGRSESLGVRFVPQGLTVLPGSRGIADGAVPPRRAATSFVSLEGREPGLPGLPPGGAMLEGFVDLAAVPGAGALAPLVPPGPVRGGPAILAMFEQLRALHGDAIVADRPLPAPGTVPEPGSALLFATAVAVAVRHKRTAGGGQARRMP